MINYPPVEVLAEYIKPNLIYLIKNLNDIEYKDFNLFEHEMDYLLDYFYKKSINLNFTQTKH